MERHEVEVDTKLAELHGRLAQTDYKIDVNKFTLARHAGIRPEYVTRTRREVKQSASELAAIVAGLLADEKIVAYDIRSAQNALTEREVLLGERAAIHAEIKPLNDDYLANQWSRFFLVQNHGGHIHKDMYCSTCRPTTLYGWLPDLSGLTEKDAVEAHGPLLCSICYPTAPVEWTMGLPVADDKCSGSGKVVESNGRRYAECPDCSKVVNVLNGGRLRAHKPEVAK